MDFLHSFTPLPGSTRRAAVARIELCQLQGVPFLISAVLLTFGKRTTLSVMAQCQVEGFVFERGTRFPAARITQETDCSLVLQHLLINSLFCEQVLVPLAKDVAAMTRRSYITEADAFELAQKTIAQAAHH